MTGTAKLALAWSSCPICRARTRELDDTRRRQAGSRAAASAGAVGKRVQREKFLAGHAPAGPPRPLIRSCFRTGRAARNARPAAGASGRGRGGCPGRRRGLKRSLRVQFAGRLQRPGPAVPWQHHSARPSLADVRARGQARRLDFVTRPRHPSRAEIRPVDQARQSACPAHAPPSLQRKPRREAARPQAPAGRGAEPWRASASTRRGEAPCEARIASERRRVRRPFEFGCQRPCRRRRSFGQDGPGRLRPGLWVSPAQGMPPGGPRSAAHAGRHAQRSEHGVAGKAASAAGSPVAKRCARIAGTPDPENTVMKHEHAALPVLVAVPVPADRGQGPSESEHQQRPKMGK